jgi:hypothetical protein
MNIKTETIYALGYFRSISILPIPESVARQNGDLYLNQVDRLVHPLPPQSCKADLLLAERRFLSTLPIRFFRSRRDLLLENLALQQQLAVLQQRHPQSRFAGSDRLFW